MSLLTNLLKITETSKKRVGHGYGSGKGGHTSTRGQKGQKSRGGSKIPVWFEGGQLPLIKRLPMLRGKGRLTVVRPSAEINLTQIQRMKTDVITLDALKLEKLIDIKFKKAKIIASGEITRKVTIKGLKISETAKKAVEKAGGIIED
ncbi:MAG: 50S ribosomal protein L15 [Candidatus Pacebacteria bacterium CG_4_10_14_3_um_filter_34_15]|nr:50S ribosomal protein L15 [Candidatus Pacearchaeota archaeon]NCQ65264.1 50S ribosomal protein L15 [Candidatus Paceibacterota bacterium]OIO45009.1 MAG: 50S ribosomal protein L15 [Candidatus Pacebacteria bacterium CG1_02_43_31]PIQ81043.1 MAG: 50S ribosomal protein L15 [Candidatus Pacebacteria bacterium CG11_big_fil_rev_8_21_14_0_20_34_55]PIX81860.1 MAG: 50S ribosomal protein L15 [Candidatus Pacebacteria bacterium CG_4_10_14_3_um_filter_34_15]PJC44075.1 MAG: 50S ribosomal protein L15 [Candidat